MPTYRRTRVPGGTYFFTVNLADRRSDLLVRHVDLLRAAVAATRARRAFTIEAWVVLPDHLHAIWTLPHGDTDFSTRWLLIKRAFSRALLANEPRSASRLRQQERGIWQRRFWEHTIRDARDFAAHIDYVHFNPVRHGLTTDARDWPFSSFHRAIARGNYPPNWSGGPDLPASGEREP